ncbi:Uncharacterized protein DAT39_001771 [Clarias magur]|uniref:Uncharacterized protein n=1 Tax=Clarias magur TaxID=1594786 RepID=A0A8J4UJE8_CLAMG|nr:Uncharacterized protein DAT39_001771 [Clarias magur]
MYHVLLVYVLFPHLLVDDQRSTRVRVRSLSSERVDRAESHRDSEIEGWRRRPNNTQTRNEQLRSKVLI